MKQPDPFWLLWAGVTSVQLGVGFLTESWRMATGVMFVLYGLAALRRYIQRTQPESC